MAADRSFAGDDRVAKPRGLLRIVEPLTIALRVDKLQRIIRLESCIELGPARVVERHSQAIDRFDSRVIVALGTDEEIVFVLSFEDGLPAPGTLYKESFGANGTFFLIVAGSRRVLFLKPAHSFLLLKLVIFSETPDLWFTS